MTSQELINIMNGIFILKNELNVWIKCELMPTMLRANALATHEQAKHLSNNST